VVTVRAGLAVTRPTVVLATPTAAQNAVAMRRDSRHTDAMRYSVSGRRGRSSDLVLAGFVVLVACGGGGGGGGAATSTVSGGLQVPQLAGATLQQPAFRADLPMRSGEVVAWIDPGVDADQLAGPELELVRSGGPIAVFRAVAATYRNSLHAGAALADSAEQATCVAAEALAARPGVRCAQPNYLMQALRQPNDQHYGKQWHYPQISLPQAWDLTTGSANVVVAVLDSGIKAAHPDFDPARVVAGWDMISDPAAARDGNGRDSNPDDAGDLVTPQSSSFHGTHVAGTIGARSDNNIGVAGVDWNCKLMHVRVLGVGGGSTDDIANGILYAARRTNGSGALPPQRADIINMSLGGPGINPVFQQACDLVAADGVLVIAAAGNDNANTPNSPAAIASVLSVGAVDILGAKAPYSNFHSSIDVWAPGGDTSRDRNGDGFGDGVLSTLANDQGNLFYDFYQGTSMAAPHVAGVAALVKAANPALTAAQIRAILIDPANTRPGASLPNGGRIVDALLAVQAAGAASSAPLLVATPVTVDFGASQTTATVLIENRGQGNAVATGATATPDAPWLSGDLSETVAGNGLEGDTLALTIDRTGLADGVYTTRITLNATVGATPTTATFDVRMRVGAAAPASDTIFVLLIDPSTFDTRFQVSSLPAAAYQWSFGNIPAGQYLLVAGTDRDNDGEIGDEGEWFGAWPNFEDTVPVAVTAGVNRAGLDFPLEDVVVINGAAAGSAPRPMFRRLR
jgi:serine protease